MNVARVTARQSKSGLKPTKEEENEDEVPDEDNSIGAGNLNQTVTGSILSHSGAKRPSRSNIEELD